MCAAGKEREGRVNDGRQEGGSNEGREAVRIKGIEGRECVKGIGGHIILQNPISRNHTT